MPTHDQWVTVLVIVVVGTLLEWLFKPKAVGGLGIGQPQEDPLSQVDLPPGITPGGENPPGVEGPPGGEYVSTLGGEEPAPIVLPGGGYLGGEESAPIVLPGGGCKDIINAVEELPGGEPLLTFIEPSQAFLHSPDGAVFFSLTAYPALGALCFFALYIGRYI